MKRKEAFALVSAILTLREGATDAQALAAVAIYPEWRVGVAYPEGQRVRRGDTLYRVRQPHTSQGGWEPENVPALFAAVSLEAGSIDKPIPALRGMDYETGKYYLDPENGKTYLCTRSATLQYLPHDLVGQYFEEAT